MNPRRTPRDDVRTSAAWAVEQALASLAPVESFLDSALSRFDERDQRLLRELVLGTLRWLRRLDQIIASASHRRFEDIEPALRAPLRVAAYQLLFLDRVPAHAVVHEAVEQAAHLTHRGGASFVNAVLRRIARSPELSRWPVREPDPIRRMAVEWSHPDLLVERWVGRFGRDRTLTLLEANNRPKPMHLLAFRDRGGRELLAENLLDAGLEVEPSFLSPLGLTVRQGDPLCTPAFRRGDFYIQDEVSQAAAWVPPPRPGERILDAAAAPGGKSFALWAWEPTVRLTLGEIEPSRLGTLRSNLSRLGRCAPQVIQDAARVSLRGPFDRIVVDLPCSGTGTLRKHPELKWRLGPEEIERLVEQGLRMLTGLAPLVAPGGVLIAITCSIEAEENEDVVDAFLAAHPEFSLLELADRLVPLQARFIRGPGLWRVFPGGDHDGFSVHVLVRR